MPHMIPTGTKFATLNLARCAVTEEFNDPLILSHDLSVHRAPLFELGNSFDADIGARTAGQFKDSNLVLMASRASAAPTIRDAEWKELDHRVFMMFYAILMHGIPNFWGGTAAHGGVTGGKPVVLHVSILPPFYWSPLDPMPRVSQATLRSAEAVVGGLLTVFGPSDYKRLRRGINALIAGWKMHPATDRLHAFVRALDAVMKLPQGKSRMEFASRLTVFATGSALRKTADEMYRLRSFDEHLSEWPPQLAHVTTADQPEFVSRRTCYAEALASFVYRTLLSDSRLLAMFRTEADVDGFWASGGAPWTVKADLDAIAARYHHIP
ncbi:MAG TPA: hypothetical protein VJM31_12310 [Vicinamibacterales bacterium]|nr:hypothetical protein [Vicinamibacterales bacterium]